MFILEWTIIAHSSSVDRDSGSLSIFRIIDEVTVPKEIADHKPEAPAAIRMPFTLLQSWERSSTDSAAKIEPRVRILDPEGHSIGVTKLVAVFGTGLKARSVGTLPFIPFTKAGNYRLISELESSGVWEERGQTTFQMKRAAT